jgi:hypothetical protein
VRHEQVSPPKPPQAPPAPPGWYARLPRRARVGLWSVFVVWIAIGVWLFGGWDVLRERVAGRPPPRRPAPELALLVVSGEAQALPAMALTHRSQHASDVVLLPAGTLVEVPGAGPRPLAAAFAETGAGGLATSVANALGIRIPVVLAGDAERVRGLVDGFGDVDVDVPESIQVEEGGFRRTLFARGRSRMGGDEFVRFMTLAVPGQSELERVARQNAGWRALLARMRSRPRDEHAAGARLEGWSNEVDGAGAARVLFALARDERLTLSTLPVVRAGLSQVELYNIDRPQIDPIRRALGDVATYRSPAGRRIRLLVGADEPVGPAAARALVAAGYAIVLSGRASQPYEVTRVVMAEDTDQARQMARRIVGILGSGTIGLAKAPQTLVDATVVVGKDWAAAHGYETEGRA